MKKSETNKLITCLHPKFFWDTKIDSLDWQKAYLAVIARIVERGGQNEIDEIVRFYGRKKVIKAIRNEIYFLPNYEDAVRFFPELKKEEIYCYLNRRDKPYPYHWI